MKTTKVLSENSFDDDIFSSKRVRAVCKGYTRGLRLRDYNAGYGDYETFCRAVEMLGRFYEDHGAQVAYRDSIMVAAEICLTLKPYNTANAALNANFKADMLGGVVYPPALVAWCAVCEIKGAYAFDMQRMYSDNLLAQEIITAACRVFENLSDLSYNDSDIDEMSRQFKEAAQND